MSTSDDTQPRANFRDPSPERDTQESAAVRAQLADQHLDEGGPTGPGCFVWGLLSLVGMGCSLVIVILAATAGWTEGHRVANATASATLAQGINEQLRRIPTDVANGNQRNVMIRLEFLATFTPGVLGVPALRMTATALHINSLSTESPALTDTPQPSATPDQSMVDAAATDDPGAFTDDTDSGYDLDALLDEARFFFRLDRYQEAYDTLDAIIRINEDFQRATVRGLMLEVLTTQATQLYRSPDDNDLAEAIRLTDMAEQYGSIGELDYERLIASLYLDVQRLSGTGDHALAIARLNTVMGYQSIYRGHDFPTMLFNERVAYADAWGLGGEYCRAVSEYDLALSLFANGAVQAKRDAAQQACEQGVPPGLTTTPGEDPAFNTYPGVPPTSGP